MSENRNDCGVLDPKLRAKLKPMEERLRVFITDLESEGWSSDVIAVELIDLIMLACSWCRLQKGLDKLKERKNERDKRIK